ncbi:hypothetical protein EWM64_g9634 [Hericium alpestre]|uniref:Fatty acid synthase type I helical domain-containing protein n=1 Tax=Hericium alpestre TaxID=135208 RepID=A0A4Y9ZLS0_9AGAM|nr:hypothetical protein EWM64_g9634 [Hericium alpestre]
MWYDIIFGRFTTVDREITARCITIEVVGQPPLYKDVTFPTASHTEVNEKGDIIYTEIVRKNVRKLEAYIEEMASPATVFGTVNVLNIWNMVKTQSGISDKQKNHIKAVYEGIVLSLRKTPISCVALHQLTSRVMLPPHLLIVPLSAC